ncbi:MAG: GNAT family protein [Halofilum sp. (in: g-proteobacteria)]|nr:GNAT family protein [Halofilum sp. (in: g-proteobacteria)]
MTEPSVPGHAPRQRVGVPVDVTDPMGTPTGAALTGAAVVVRPPDPAGDAGPLYAGAHGDPATEALWTYMPYGPFAGPGVMRAWLEDCAASTDPAFRVVADRASGEALGMASYLNHVPGQRRIELGHIWYCPRAQGTRVNTETVWLMLRECFERGARRVEWKCDALNARSRQAALRLGFRFEGVFRQHQIVKGRNRDTAWYALVDADWPAVRANMERWLHGDEEGLSLTELNAPLVADFHDPAAPARKARARTKSSARTKRSSRNRE